MQGRFLIMIKTLPALTIIKNYYAILKPMVEDMLDPIHADDGEYDD